MPASTGHQEYSARPTGPYHDPGDVKTNGLGLAGFLVSFVGLITCGFASIISLVLCIFALKKEPRSLAVAGFILSMFGVSLFLSMLSLQITGVILSSQLFGPAFMNAIQSMGVVELEQASAEVAAQWEADGQIPDLLRGQKIVTGHMDQWGSQIDYETDGESFTVISWGPDRKPDTADDIKLGPFLAPDEAPTPDVVPGFNQIPGVIPVNPPDGIQKDAEEQDEENALIDNEADVAVENDE